MFTVSRLVRINQVVRCILKQASTRGGESRYRHCRYCRRLLSFQTSFLKKTSTVRSSDFGSRFVMLSVFWLFITVFHRPYLLDIYNRILVSRQINAKHQSLKAFTRKWCLKNVLSGKRLSGKVTVRETSDNRQEYGLVPFSNNIRGDTPVRYPVKST